MDKTKEFFSLVKDGNIFAIWILFIISIITILIIALIAAIYFDISKSNYCRNLNYVKYENNYCIGKIQDNGTIDFMKGEMFK